MQTVDVFEYILIDKLIYLKKDVISDGGSVQTGLH